MGRGGPDTRLENHNGSRFNRKSGTDPLQKGVRLASQGGSVRSSVKYFDDIVKTPADRKFWIRACVLLSHRLVVMMNDSETIYLK